MLALSDIEQPGPGSLIYAIDQCNTDPVAYHTGVDLGGSAERPKLKKKIHYTRSEPIKGQRFALCLKHAYGIYME